jgi:hypothetical protein
MDPVNLPVAGIPGRDAQCNPPVIKIQDMLESIANILRLLVGDRIDISIADIVEALPGLLYALNLDFAKVVRKLPVISLREILDIDVEIGFSLIPFFHKLFPRYSLFKDIIIIPSDEKLLNNQCVWRSILSSVYFCVTKFYARGV